MRYIRYLIYLAFYSALVFGGLWLYGLFKGPGLAHINFISRPVIMIAVIALLPIFKALNKKKTTELPKIEGISSSALVLECSYRGSLAVPPEDLRSAMKEICESLLFPDRYLSLVYEDATLIEFQTMPLDGEIGEKRSRKNRAPESTVSIEIEPEDELSSLRLVSKSDNFFSSLDNDANEAHISAIVGALFERGLVGDANIE